MTTEDKVALAEKALGFKLHQWQRDLLLGLEPDMSFVPARRSGRTTVYMLQLALSEGPAFTVSGLRGPGGYYTAPRRDDVELPVDYPSYSPALRSGYRQWFVQQYTGLCKKLKAAGLRPRWIKGFYNSKF